MWIYFVNPCNIAYKHDLGFSLCATLPRFSTKLFVSCLGEVIMAVLDALMFICVMELVLLKLKVVVCSYDALLRFSA